MEEPTYIKIKEGEYEERKVGKRKVLITEIDKEVANFEGQKKTIDAEILRLKNLKKFLEELQLNEEKTLPV